MALTGVTNKKFYSVLLSWKGYFKLEKGEHYQISKSVPGTPTELDPNPSDVSKTLMFTMAKEKLVWIESLEGYVRSAGFDDMGITYDRIAAFLVENPDSVIYIENLSEIDPDIPLELSSPEAIGEGAMWDFLNAFPMGKLAEVMPEWKSIGVALGWPTLTAQTVTDIGAFLTAWNTEFAEKDTIAGADAARARFKTFATNTINNQA